MSNKALVGLIIVVNLFFGGVVATIPFWLSLPFMQKAGVDLSGIPVPLSYGFFAAIMVVTLRVFVQLLFIRSVKTDDSPIELMMPWAMANLWDDPKQYFPENAASLYRPWRVFANVTTPLFITVVVGLAIFYTVT